MDKSTKHATFVIVGGGIAGVTCAEQLSLECPEESVILISASPLIKAVANVKQLTRALQDFDVKEQPLSTLEVNSPNVKVIHDVVDKLDASNHVIHLTSGNVMTYVKLCLCAGGIPKVIAKDNPYILGIRDTETVHIGMSAMKMEHLRKLTSESQYKKQMFQEKLKDAQRIIVIGNGGIATELVYEVENCQVIWAIRHTSIGATFFDSVAAKFFLPHLQEKKENVKYPLKRTKYTTSDVESTDKTQGITGSALGPDWSLSLSMKGSGQNSRNVHVEYNCEVASIYTPEEFLQKGLTEKQIDEKIIKDQWPVYVELTNGAVYGCDFIVSATGVVPNVEPFLSGNKFEVDEDDGGIKVDDQLRTSVPDVYAAGDICTASWELSQQWFQMRLWTQGRLMGGYAARSMISHLKGEEAILDIGFDLFAHVTRFFGYKVVLLGLFNGQKLGTDYEMLLRISQGKEFVKVILQNDLMQGAILIGETDLEETFENLILNKIDLSPYGDDLLNPNIDIEDYFD